jgi:lactoylglutathione lyase
MPPSIRRKQAMKLAKNHIDVGLFSNRREEQLAFWQQAVGLPFDQMGKLGGGIQQHRHHMNGSILKLNHSRNPLPTAPASAILELRIARSSLSAAQLFADPDGNRVKLVPPGTDGVVGIGVVLQVSDLVASDHFYVNAMGFLREGEGVWRCGDTLLIAGERGPVANIGVLRAPGFRYLTVQVWDCVAEHAGVLARGGTEGRPPAVLGDTVQCSFVLDPDGTFIEISQRASLTGGRL